MSYTDFWKKLRDKTTEAVLQLSDREIRVTDRLTYAFLVWITNECTLTPFIACLNEFLIACLLLKSNKFQHSV